MNTETIQSWEVKYEPGTMPEIFHLINKLAKRLDQFQRGIIKNTGLTPPQYCVLNVLPENGGYKLSELATACYCSRSTMTNLVDNLIEKKLVKRDPHPRDRRSIIVKLTEEGKRLKQSMPSLNRIFGNCCSGLEQKELQQLSLLLKKVEKSLIFDESCQK